jgi:hypothetical protein
VRLEGASRLDGGELAEGLALDLEEIWAVCGGFRDAEPLTTGITPDPSRHPVCAPAAPAAIWLMPPMASDPQRILDYKLKGGRGARTGTGTVVG